MKLHTIIRKLREQADLTQENLAVELGVDKTTIGRYEKNEEGAAKISIEQLQKIASVFGMTLQGLLAYQEKPTILEEPIIPAYEKKSTKRTITLSIELDGEKETLNFWLDRLKKVNAAMA